MRKFWMGLRCHFRQLAVVGLLLTIAVCRASAQPSVASAQPGATVTVPAAATSSVARGEYPQGSAELGPKPAGQGDPEPTIPNSGETRKTEGGELLEKIPSSRSRTSSTQTEALQKLAQRPGKIVIVPIHDMVDLGLAPFVRRALSDTTGVSVIIFDVNTFGGRIDAAVKIRDAILHCQVPTVAFVNPRAISAGALISLASDFIVFTPGGTMGAATPIQLEGGQAKPVAEKMVSYMRSEMRATAEAKGRSGEIAEAMVDADMEIPGLSKKGKLLTLTTETAMDTGVATATAASLESLLKLAYLDQRPLARQSTSWGEKLARFLTDPTVAGLLMSLGMLGLMIELYSPGFGLPGIVGITSLVFFFGGHWFAELAGLEEIILALMGIGLLTLEILVIPGFGWAGASGIICLVTSLAMAMLDVSFTTAWQTGLLSRALGLVLLSLFGSIAVLVVLFAALRRAGRRGQYSTGSWLVLDRTLESARAPIAGPADNTNEPFGELIGAEGVAWTDLRPSGKVKVGDRLLDVVSELRYIRRGEPIRVVAVEGVRITVTEALR